MQSSSVTGAILPNRPLQKKVAVIFGAGGDVGSGVAQEFATQGARLYLAGRTLGNVKRVADAISREGHPINSDQVDALDEQSVRAYLDRVAEQEGGVDILLNVTGPQPKEYGNGTPILELPLEQFLIPLTTLVPSQFITARAVAQHMVRRHMGVILFVLAVPARGITPESISIGAAFGAMESLLRSFAISLGPAGVRVVGVRSGPMMDTRTIQWTRDKVANRLGVTPAEVSSRLEQASLLKSSSNVSDTARLAAFLASDAARTITGAVVNANSGRFID